MLFTTALLKRKGKLSFEVIQIYYSPKLHIQKRVSCESKISFVVGNTDRLDKFSTQNFKLNPLLYSSFITSVTSHSVSHRWSLRHVKNGPYMISTHKFRQASIYLTGYIRWSSSEIRNDKLDLPMRGSFQLTNMRHIF